MRRCRPRRTPCLFWCCQKRSINKNEPIWYIEVLSPPGWSTRRGTFTCCNSAFHCQQAAHLVASGVERPRLESEIGLRPVVREVAGEPWWAASTCNGSSATIMVGELTWRGLGAGETKSGECTRGAASLVQTGDKHTSTGSRDLQQRALYFDGVTSTRQRHSDLRALEQRKPTVSRGVW